MELGLLRCRLAHEHDFDVQVFAYPTLHGDAAAICAELADTVRREPGPPACTWWATVWAAPSCIRALQQCAAEPGGNAVLLGSPLNGSRAAQGALRWPMLRPLLGSHVVEELAEASAAVAGRAPTPLGAIAGIPARRHGPVLRALRDRQRRHGRGRARPSSRDWPITSCCRTATSACCSRPTSRRRWRTSCARVTSPAVFRSARAPCPTSRRPGRGRAPRTRAAGRNARARGRSRR